MSEQFENREPETRRRWVRVVLIIVGVLILLFVVLRIVGGGAGDHGPQRHFGSGAVPAITS